MLYKLTEYDAEAINRRREDAQDHLAEHQSASTGAQVHVGNRVYCGDTDGRHRVPMFKPMRRTCPECGDQYDHDPVSGRGPRQSASLDQVLITCCTWSCLVEQLAVGVFCGTLR